MDGSEGEGAGCWCSSGVPGLRTWPGESPVSPAPKLTVLQFVAWAGMDGGRLLRVLSGECERKAEVTFRRLNLERNCS